MSAFEEKAQGIFARFSQKLAQVDLRTALVVPAGIGCAIALAGVGQEFHGQMHVLQQGGFAALDAYKNAMHAMGASSLGDWVQRGLAGKLHSFGGNTQATGFAIMTGAPVISAASVLLARGFNRFKSILSDRSDRLQAELKAKMPVEKPDEEGRFTWARERAEADHVDPVWRNPAPVTPAALPMRIGTIEMLERIALAHRINVKELIFEDDAVQRLSTGSQTLQPVCQVGSRFWKETERDALVAHRYASMHQLDPNKIYVREGNLYERNDEAFAERVLCRLSPNSPEWDAADRALLREELGLAPELPAYRDDAVDHADSDASRARFRPS